MAQLNTLVFQQAFTSSSLISVSHGADSYFINVKVVISGEYRTDLIESITIVDQNTCTIVLKSSQTGFVQIFNPDLILASSSTETASTRNQIVSATNTISISNLTNTLISGMTITPPAGTYAVFATIDCSFQKSSTLIVSIYAGGTIYQPSHMNTSRGTANGSELKTCSTQGFVTVNGSQAIEFRGAYTGSPISANDRSMIILRVY